MKMRDSLKDQSRIFTSYEKFKKELRDKYEEDLTNTLIEKYGDETNE